MTLHIDPSIVQRWLSLRSDFRCALIDRPLPVRKFVHEVFVMRVENVLYNRGSDGKCQNHINYLQ